MNGGLVLKDEVNGGDGSGGRQAQHGVEIEERLGCGGECGRDELGRRGDEDRMRVRGGIVSEEGIERRVEGLDLLAIVVEGVRVERGQERVARRRDGGGHFAHGVGQTVAEEVGLRLGVMGGSQRHGQGVEGCGGGEEHEGQRALRGVGDGLAAPLSGQRRGEPCDVEDGGVTGEERKGERRGIDGDSVVNAVVGVSVVGNCDGGLLHVEQGLREEEGRGPTATA